MTDLAEERHQRLSLYDLHPADVERILAGEPAYRARQVWRALYRQLRLPEEMTDVPAGLRRRLTETAPPALRAVGEAWADDGDTQKFLWGLRDGAQIETVLMRYPDRTTVCVSSQAGCAMGCGFCATGQAGFQRHLTPGEIVEQVVRAARRAGHHPSGRRGVTNVVLMGMGEPLANYERVWAALRRLHEHVGIGARHLTISTVGLVPGIRRLASEPEPVNLAVSLHAADDELRDRLVPINRRHPLDELMAACADYVDATRRRLSFEWALIDGVNDGERDAERLARRVLPLRAHVNLIPLNPTPGWPTTGTPPARVALFARRLAERGVNATVRRNRGVEIAAACGQLAARAGPGPVGDAGEVELAAPERRPGKDGFVDAARSARTAV